MEDNQSKDTDENCREDMDDGDCEDTNNHYGMKKRTMTL